MFDASADYYDLLYSTFKDYAAEAAAIAALLRRLNPACRTVLDVACGTGEHAKRLAADGFEVDGLDLSPEFVAIARAKHPAGRDAGNLVDLHPHPSSTRPIAARDLAAAADGLLPMEEVAGSIPRHHPVCTRALPHRATKKDRHRCRSSC